MPRDCHLSFPGIRRLGSQQKPNQRPGPQIQGVLHLPTALPKSGAPTDTCWKMCITIIYIYIYVFLCFFIYIIIDVYLFLCIMYIHIYIYLVVMYMFHMYIHTCSYIYIFTYYFVRSHACFTSIIVSFHPSIHPSTCSKM